MDVAQLAIQVENGQVVKATASLNQMTVAGTKTEAATQRLTRRMGLLEVQAREMDAAMVKSSRAATLLSGALAGFSAVAAVGLILRETVTQTVDAQNAMAQLEAAVTSTGGAAGRTVAQLDALSMQLQRQTTYSDEAVKGAEAMLLTFDKIRGTEFDRATAAVTDLAARMGGDLQAAAVQVGKALQDPATGLTALRRSGVSFSAAQIEVIKHLYETGRAAEGQRVILAELEHQFGGSAKAARDTLGGALAGLKNSFGDLFEVTKGGSQGTVDAINGITHAIENSGVSMDAFMTNTIIGWNNIVATMKKAQNIMAMDITSAADRERVRQVNARIDFDNAAEEARLRGRGKVGGAVGVVAPLGTDLSAEAIREAKRLAEELRRNRERQDHDREIAEQRYMDDINQIWDRGMADIVESTDRGFRAVLESVSGFIDKLVERMLKEGRSSPGLEMAGMALSGGLAGAATGLAIGGRTTSRPLGALGGALGGAAAGAMAGGPIGAAAGALAGFVSGIIGSGNAAKEAAKALDAMRSSFRLNFEAMDALIRNDPLGVAIAQAKAYFEEQRRIARELNQVFTYLAENNPLRVAQQAALDAELARLNDQEAKRIAQLKAEGDAVRSTSAAMLNLANSFKSASYFFRAIDPNGYTGPRSPFAPPTSRTESRTPQFPPMQLVVDGRVMGEVVVKAFGGRPSGNPQTGFIDLVQKTVRPA